MTQAPSKGSGRGPLIILSGPSGCGKSTIITRLLERKDLPLRLSVSATTRPPRAGEKDGVDYFYWTREQFEKGLKDGEFLEHADVYGNYYGTLKREVEPFRDEGIGVLLDIDVQGAEQVRQQCPDQVSIFLAPPSLASLEARLRSRGTEDVAQVERRLEASLQEMRRADEFDFQVTNDNLEQAVGAVHAILQKQFKGGLHAR